MDGNTLKTKIEQGIENDYRVFVDTVEGSQHRVVAVLGANPETVSVKLKNGMATISADKVVAIRELEFSDNRPKEDQ